MPTETGLRFEPLEPRQHNRSHFSCSEPSLERYLKEQARKDQESRVCVVFVLTTDEQKVMGYYTLSSTSVLLEGLPAEQTKRLPKYPHIPATLLGRLAVDQQYQGQGYGGDLLFDALRRAYQASQNIASWAVVVDALHENAAAFYAKYGFIALPDEPLRLYLPMKTVQALLEKYYL